MMNKEEAIVSVAEQIQAHDLELIRFAWCDVHGVVRCKSLSAAAAMRALDNGVGMVSTLFLKDAVGRTVYKIFEPETAAQLPDFAFASNVQLMPLPHTFKVLPWAEKTGWILCDAVFPNGEPVGFGYAPSTENRSGEFGQAWPRDGVWSGGRAAHLPL